MSDQDTSRTQQIDRIIAQYLEAAGAGARPDREAFLATHPQFRAELEEFFNDERQFVGLAGAPLADCAPTIVQGVLPEDAKTLPPTQTFVRYMGDYELLEELGRGGMGVVYKARQMSLDRPVALKMILSAQFATADDVARFQVEAKHAATLDHPSIVPVFEVGEHHGQHYFSMKLVDGGSLASMLARFTKDHRAAVTLLAGAARAVHHAHERGVLHRDLKPGNILVDSEGRPQITDFGLARRLDGGPGMTQTGALVGTPQYMAPEQARGDQELTPATDVYALGTVFYHVLTGRPPFVSTTAMETLRMAREQEPARPSGIVPQLDADLETICLKCLEKEPRLRYPTAAALADDLERWLRGEPVLARPVGSAGRLLRWCRRKPVVAGLSAAVALLLVTLGIVGIVNATRPNPAGAGGTFAAPVRPAGMNSAAVSDLAIVLSCSAGMAEPTSAGPTRMDVARESVKKLVRNLPDGVRVLFVVYGHDAALKCQAVKIVRPLAPLDAAGRDALLAEIDGLRPVGDSPMGLALRRANEELTKNGAQLAGVVLISDGRDTCDGNPAAEAEALSAITKAEPGMRVVGVGVTKADARSELERIAKAAGATYQPAENPAQLDAALKPVGEAIRPPQNGPATAPAVAAVAGTAPDVKPVGGTSGDYVVRVATPGMKLPPMKALAVVKHNDYGPDSKYFKPIALFVQYGQDVRLETPGPYDVWWIPAVGKGVRMVTNVRINNRVDIKPESHLGVVRVAGEGLPQTVEVACVADNDYGMDSQHFNPTQTTNGYGQDLVVPAGKYDIWTRPADGGKPERLEIKLPVNGGEIAAPAFGARGVRVMEPALPLPPLKEIAVIPHNDYAPGSAHYAPMKAGMKYGQHIRLPSAGGYDIWWIPVEGKPVQMAANFSIAERKQVEVKPESRLGIVRVSGAELPKAKLIALVQENGYGMDSTHFTPVQVAAAYGTDMVVPAGRHDVWIQPADGGKPERIEINLQVNAGEIVAPAFGARGVTVQKPAIPMPDLKEIAVIHHNDYTPGSKYYRPVHEGIGYGQHIRLPSSGGYDIWWTPVDGKPVLMVDNFSVAERKGIEIQPEKYLGIVRVTRQDLPKPALVALVPVNGYGMDSTHFAPAQTAPAYGAEMVVPAGKYQLWVRPAENEAKPRMVEASLVVEAGKVAKVE